MNETPKQQDSQEITGHYVKVDILLNEPWQVTGAFQTMREAARLHGFPDIEDIHVSLKVTFYGSKSDSDIEALKTRFDNLWFPVDVNSKPRYRKELDNGPEEDELKQAA